LLCKPIILLLVSIIEAVLHDLHRRIKTFTIEGVQNLATSAGDYIRLKKIDEFEKYIASAKKHDLFNLADSGFYQQLDELEGCGIGSTFKTLEMILNATNAMRSTMIERC
jgi:hypothetical protein